MKRSKRTKQDRKAVARKGKEVCLVCQQEKSGAPVNEDFMIRGLRRLKQAFRASTGNKLVICESCKEIATKKRQAFERTLMTYLGLGGIVLIIMVIFALMSGGPIISVLQSILVLLFLILLLALLSLLNYFPSFKGYSEKEKKEDQMKKRKIY